MRAADTALWIGGTANRNRDAFELTLQERGRADSEGIAIRTFGFRKDADHVDFRDEGLENIDRRKVSPATEEVYGKRKS